MPGKRSKYAARYFTPSGSFQKPIGMHGKGAVQTSSPFSPRTGWPSSFQTSTFSPSPRHCSSPRQTGSTGLPSAKHETMSVPPEIELSCTSDFTRA